MAAIHQLDDSVRLAGDLVCGELDGVAEDLLQLAAREGDLRLDLAAIGRCDSSAVALLAACLEIKLRLRSSLRLINVPAQLTTLFRVYGLDEVFPPA